MRLVAGLAVAVLAVGQAGAQGLFHPAGPLPAFEVATIKRAAGDEGGTVLRYVEQAFNIPVNSDVRVAGAPAWLTAERYVIVTKASDAERDAMQKMNNDDSANERRKMQQTLLAERFHLKVHFEMREMAVYELVVEKGGLKMKEAAAPAPGQSGVVPLPEKLTAATLAAGTLAMQIKPGSSEQMFGNAVPLRAVVNALMNRGEVGGRPIVDKTGLRGVYDVTVAWALTTPGGGNGGVASGESNLPAVFTALKEQLGLELVAKKEPVEVVVIDGIERPTEN